MSADLLTERGVRRLIQATADVYREALDAPTIGYEMPPLMRKKLEEDIFVFSGFKTYHQLKEASLLLRDEAGGLKPFYKFYQDVTSIKEKYNRHWLRAEYNFATASAEMAAQWAAYEEVKGTTYLQYRTALDDRVRAEHAALEGVTLPQDDPFWNTAFPPNGWNCRCHVIPLPQEGHTTSNSEAARLSFRQLTEGRDSIFRFNPGKEAVLFPPHHPYYGKQGYRHCANQRLAANDDKHDPGDPCRVYQILKEMMENEKNIVIPTKRGKVIETPGINRRELENNVKIATYIAETHGDEIYLLADKFDGHSPDSYNATKKRFEEYKYFRRNTFNAFDKRIQEGAKQANDIVLIIEGAYEKKDLIRAIRNRVSSYENLQSIRVIEDFKKDVLILRDDVINGDISL